MKRYDGNELNLGALKTLEPFVMKYRSASWVLCIQQFDLSKTLHFIKEYNEEHNLDKKSRLTLFQIILCAGARAIALHPQVNRFISGKRYFQRNRLNFAFVVKPDMTPESPETLTKFDMDPFETIDSIRVKMHSFVKEARSDAGSDAEKQIQLLAKLPHRIKVMANNIISRRDYKGKLGPAYIESDPMFCSAVFANLGSVKLDGLLVHHTYEYGNSSVFVTLGRIRKGIVISENNEVQVRDVVDIAFNIYERISGGRYLADVLMMVKNLVENPEKLIEKPDIPEEIIKELNLVDLAKYKPYLKLKKKK